MDKSSKEYLNILMDNANQNKDALLRMKGWEKVIQWNVDGESFFWKIEGGKISFVSPKETDFILKTDRETLKKLAMGEMPLFLAIWAWESVKFEGSFSDAFRIGYLFLLDKRSRKVVFLPHCYLNMNTRFPEGADFEAANIPLVQFLLSCGVGIVQMPCPEFQCFGLEKTGWGEVQEKEARKCYWELAEGVVDQMAKYLELGYEVPVVIGMNPSPSCGVELSKGKGTMLGVNRDTSEAPEPGVFMQAIKDLLKEKGIEPPVFFGIRRTLPGESGQEKRLEELKNTVFKQA
jgi:predicted secreted protein